jgi:DNA polymerase I
MSNNSTLKPGDHLYLIDGSGYIFRAYFQSTNQDPKYNKRSDGLPVGAVRLYCNMLWGLLKSKTGPNAPTHIAVIFDHSSKTFRNDFYPEYKAHRPEPPADMRPQFSLIRQATRAFNLPSVELENYEADDLIATYVKQAVAVGATVRIITSDKDMMQLIQPGVEIFDPGKEKVIGPDEVLEKFGVTPDKVVDVQAILGDASDNVPGVEGVGEKSASPVIRELGSLEAILNDPEGSKRKLSGLLAELNSNLKLIAGEEVKLGSGTLLAKIAFEKFGIEVVKRDKKGEPTLDGAGVEELAASGNSFYKTVIRAKEVQKSITTVDSIVAQKDRALVSKRLVTLVDDVPVKEHIDSFSVDQPRASEIIGFLKAMEFTTITKTVATGLDADISAIDPVSVEIKYWPPEGGVPQAPDKPKSEMPNMFAGHLKATPVEETDALAALRTIPVNHAEYETITTIAALDKWIAAAMDQGFVCIDTETDSLDAMQAKIVGVSLALAPGRACYIPLAHKGAGDGLFAAGLHEGQIPLEQALPKLKQLFEAPSIMKIGQNLKYDMLLLKNYGINVAPLDDTMLLSYVTESGDVGHGMDELSQRHLGHKPIAFKDVAGSGKSTITFDRVAIDKATAYAAEDADITLRLWMVLKQKLLLMHKVTVYETLERPLVPVLTQMEFEGIEVDRGVLAKLSSEFANKQAIVETEIHKLAGQTFNIGSPKQLGEILYDKMALPGGRKTATGAWSTDSDALDDLATQGIDLAKRVLDWRQLAKLRSTYTDALPEFINPKTGRVHTSYAMASTSTGRLSSTDPNLQNIPVRTDDGRRIRTAFVAPKGKKLISADYSQIELRVLAHVAHIPQLTKAFADGLDIHAMTASEMFGVPIEGMESSVRRRAKAINFGIIYGISAFGLANQLSISREEAGEYIRTYFKRFPGIKDYMEATKAFARTNQYVETIFGRRMHFPRINSPNPSEKAFLERASINAPIQGSAADIIRRAMVRMSPALEQVGLKARMLLQVHDELIFECDESEVAATLKLVKSVMEKAPEPALKLSVPLSVDARAANNWDEAH